MNIVPIDYCKSQILHIIIRHCPSSYHDQSCVQNSTVRYLLRIYATGIHVSLVFLIHFHLIHIRIQNYLTDPVLDPGSGSRFLMTRNWTVFFIENFIFSIHFLASRISKLHFSGEKAQLCRKLFCGSQFTEYRFKLSRTGSETQVVWIKKGMLRIQVTGNCGCEQNVLDAGP